MSICKEISLRGFFIFNDVLNCEEVETLQRAMENLPVSDDVRKKTNIYGVRNLLSICSATRELAKSPKIRNLVEPVLGPSAFAARATFFDKVPDANWNLRYHQDTVISVKAKKEVPGFYSWATKGDVQQVRPPDEILMNMLAIRVHLDDCHANNGALRVLAGSHQQKYERAEIPACRQRFKEAITEIREGGVLAMRPLLLHASSASEVADHRRVIHIEYAANDLPGGLEWQQRICSGENS